MITRAAQRGLGIGLLACSVLAFGGLTNGPAKAQAAPQKASSAAEAGPGVPFTAEKMTTLLPPSVYFAGRTAPLQTRNAGGTKFGNGAIFWVSLVDSSGYASSVQERYQFYVVTEGPVRFGDVTLRPGAYGGGFVGERFLLMDLGDHSIGEGPVQTDTGLRRPRPLQVVADQPGAVKLYLGRRWVTVRTAE